MDSDHIFLSYARRDGQEFIERLEQDLTAAGYKTWRDKRNLNEYSDFSAEIETGIRSANCVAVCVTPSVEQNPSSFVRREIIYAQAKNKPIIPLVFPKADVPVLINHLTWIPFFEGEQLRYDAGFGELIRRLSETPKAAAGIESDDPFREYLLQLYDWIVSYLEKSVFSLITLGSVAVPDQVEVSETPTPILPTTFLNTFALTAGIQGETTTHAASYESFAEAFEAYQRRVLLLGDPGSGKTTTLMAFARDAIVGRLENQAAPLPLLAPVSTWDMYAQPSLADWLSNSVPSLKEQIHEAFQAGEALLLLDGLDELGSERPVNPEQLDGTTFDPRQRFMENIPPQNAVVLTCRMTDYQAIGEKVNLNGAIYLQPLADDQIGNYLENQPELQAILQRDEQLKSLVRTPLLLSIVTFAFANTADDLNSLEGLPRGDVSDKIFDAYLRRRYDHESRKPFANLPYAYDKMIKILQCVARTDATGESQNTLNSLYIHQCLGYEPEPFIEQASRLHILVSTIDPSVYRFIHWLLRDYFAYPDLIRSLTHQDQWRRLKAAQSLGDIADVRAVDALSNVLRHDADENVRAMAASALGKISDSEAVPTILEALQDNRARVRATAAQALGQIGDGRALDGLILLAQDGDKPVRHIALEAISWLHDLEAIPALITVLGDSNAGVAQAAATALSNMGQAAVPAMIEALHSGEATVRSRAALTLGQMQAVEAGYDLVSLLTDETSVSYVQRVCDVAAAALELIGTPDALAAVGAWRGKQQS